MNEIEAKAKELARPEGTPIGSYDICKYAVAIEMAKWTEERIIEKVYKFIESINLHSYICEPDCNKLLIEDFKKQLTM